MKRLIFLKKALFALLASLLIVLSFSANTLSESTQVKIGDYVTFGYYPQTKNGYDFTPIEWLVLDIQDGKALLISRYGIDQIPYEMVRDDTTWATSSIRDVLNDKFIRTAFTTEEQEAIILTDVDNSAAQCSDQFDSIGGKDTKDKIFLLSYAEANRYLNVTFSNKNNKKARVVPTAYAIEKGVHTDAGYDAKERGATAAWWLRSPGYYQNMAAIVDVDGSLKNSSAQSTRHCTRPAMWVDLNSNPF